MIRIQKLSRILRIVLQILFIATPVFTAIYWFYFKSLTHAGMTPDLPVINSEVVTNASTRYMAFLVSLLPTMVIMYGLHHTILLLKTIESGNMFSNNNPKRVIRIGSTLLALVAIGVIYDLLISYVITFHNPPGHHVIAVSIGMSDFTALIMSMVMIITGLMLREANNKIQAN